ncbi:MAG: NAD(P)H-dependent oxidoreductase [Candidatus Adiutricales bacterium]
MKEKIIEAFNFRHACKKFDSEKKISARDFNFILETGRLSPSSFGFEPWNFLVVQNIQLREKLRGLTWGGQGQIPTASHLLVVLARKSYFMKYDSQYIQSFMKDVQNLPENIIEMKRNVYQKFLENDFKLLDNERAVFDWACKQTYIPLTNMMTAAAMIGIDSCPMEGFEADKIDELLAGDFDIDIEKFGISCMVAFGYRDAEPSAKTRQPLENIIKWYN